MRANRRTVLSLAAVAGLSVATPVMAAEDNAANKATAERYITEVLNGGNVGVLDEIVSPEYVSQKPDEAAGIDALKTRVDQMNQFDGFSVADRTYTIEAMAVKSPNVFVRGYITGTSSGGKKVNAVYFYQFEFRDGLIVTDWSLRDEIGLLGL